MKQFVLALHLLLAIGTAAAAPAPFAKPVRRTGLEPFQGEWDVLSYAMRMSRDVRGGQEGMFLLASKEVGDTLTVTGDRFRLFRRGKLLNECTIRVTGDGFGIDFTHTKPRLIVRGVYRWEGDTLFICNVGGRKRRTACQPVCRPGRRVAVRPAPKEVN